MEPLIAALGDGNSDVRRAAAEALGKIGDPCAVEPLIVVLLDDVDPDGRAAAAEALAQIGDARAVRPLLLALQDEKKVRKAAAEALVKMYHSGRLEEAHKRLILAHREEITRPHTDEVDCHHSDEGIGVNFPL